MRSAIQPLLRSAFVRTFLSLTLVLPSLARAQDGALDISFQSPKFAVPVSLVAVEADGRVLYAVGGNNAAYTIGRLNSDGSPAAALLTGDGAQSITDPIDFGTIHIPGATNPATVSVLSPLPNGQILVGGAFSHFNKVPRRLLVRLNADGSVDSSFNAANGFQGEFVYCIAQGTGGKIYVGGKFTKFGSSTRNVALVRLHSDGTLDDTFADSTISFGASVGELSLQPDGKPLIDAAYANGSFQATMQVYRLGPNGGLDGGFAQGAGTPSTPGPLRHGLLPGGQLLLTGGTGTYNGTSVNQALFRVNGDGTVDSGYAGLSLGLSNTGGLIGRFLPGPNGTLYVSGAFDKVDGQARLGMARLKSDGTLDPTFVPGATVTSSPGAVALQTDGKIVAGSTVIVGADVKFNLVRLNGSGGTSTPTPQLGTLVVQPGGAFRLGVSGGATRVVVQSSADLTSWTSTSTNSVVDGAITFSDPAAAASTTRFYRLIAVP